MADHLQQQLLQAYQATLVAAGTAAGARVYLDRVDEIPQAYLPALHIEGQGEVVETISADWAGIQQRAYTFTVDAITGSNSGAAAAARDLAKQVEIALFASQAVSTASGRAKQLRLEGSSFERDASATVATFGVRQSWLVDYITQSGIPDASF
jgi:hypothetical protein